MYISSLVCSFEDSGWMVSAINFAFFFIIPHLFVVLKNLIIPVWCKFMAKVILSICIFFQNGVVYRIWVLTLWIEDLIIIPQEKELVVVVVQGLVSSLQILIYNLYFIVVFSNHSFFKEYLCVVCVYLHCIQNGQIAQQLFIIRNIFNTVGT